MAARSKKRAKAREPLSLVRALQVAASIADREGLELLTMRRLAQELGVEAMSLYHHVANKDAILSGIVDLVAAELEVPAPGGDWRAAMRRRAHRAHEVLMRHPWATMLIVSRANVGPTMLRYVDATITCLREAGFSWAMADHAWNALDSYVYGFTLQKLNFPFAPGEYAKAAKQFIHLIPPEQFPGLNGMSQEVIAGRHDGLHELGFGLELLLEGLERLRPPRGARDSTR